MNGLAFIIQEKAKLFPDYLENENWEEKPMKKINQFLPFILWSIATIILTILAFIMLPALILWKKVEGNFHGNAAESDEKQPEINSVFVI